MAFRHAETVGETPQAFIARFFGAEGRDWLARVPTLRDEIALSWQLEVGPPLRGGLMSVVHLVKRPDGSRAVLKIGGPWAPTSDEADALGVWGGGPTPTLLAVDVQRGALLLELIGPGTGGVDAAATEVARVLQSLHVEPPSHLPSLHDHVHARLETARRAGRPEHKLAWALAKVAELERDAPPPRLLHGDFDERNLLLCARRGLVAIDPWPCLGDPAYDAGYWVHGNRRPGRRARFDAIVEATGLPRERVRDWTAVVGVHG